MTVYSKLPDMIEYYMARWEHLNLISPYNHCVFDSSRKIKVFEDNPDQLLEIIKNDGLEQFPGLED